MAILPGRLAGIVALQIDGVSFVVRGGAKYRANNVERETIRAQSGIPGYKEMPMAGRIEAVLSDAGDLSVGLLGSLTLSTVTMQLANGKGVTGAAMWVVESQEVETEEGQFSIAFEGPLVEEFAL